MAGADGSSEEFVDDDSGEEEEGASLASFYSEGDEDLGVDDEDQIFESKQPSRKKANARAVTVAAEPDGKTNAATKMAAKAPSSSAALKKVGASSGGKGKGRVGKAQAMAPARAHENAAQSSHALNSQGDEVPATPVDDPMPSPAAASSPVVPLTPVAGTPTPSNGSGSGSARADGSGRKPGNGVNEAAEKGVAKTPKAAVSDYMAKANRPFSAINVFDNLHKKIPKAMVQKLLDELVTAGPIKVQEYGKSKIYYPNQDTLPNGAGDVSESKLQRLDQEAKDLAKKLEVVAAQAREAQSRVQALASQPTDASLDEQLASTAQELEKMEARNTMIKGQGHTVVAGGMQAAKTDFNKYRALWVTRKRNAMEVIDMIADGMEKKPKHVMEMLGVELDEEAIPPKM